MLTKEQQRKHELLKGNFPYYAKHALKIKNKAGQLVPLVLNQAQQYIHNKIENQLAQTGKVRVLIPKSRQMGSSTYLEGRFYHKTAWQKGKNAFILAHDSETTKKIFDMAKRYHDNVPLSIKPATKNSNAKELIFKDLDSQYFVGTAGSPDVGRGGTIQYLHGSEVAFWKNTDGIQTGLMQSVADIPNTEIALESTGNGIGNMFYNLCMDSIAGKNEYEVIFLPWFWMDEYERDEAIIPTREEEEIIKAYLLEYDKAKQLRKLAWRRNKIAEFKREWKFRQEYPSTLLECFQTSGDSLIRAEDIVQARNCKTKDRDSPIIMGVDPARSGDRTAIVFRRGREMPHYYTWDDMDEMRLVGIVANLIEKHKVHMVNIDVAYGWGTIDRLHERGYKNVNGVHFGEKAIEDDVYRNKRAEMWCSMANWLEKENVNIPDDNDLHADLACVPDIRYTSDGTIKLESKEKIKEEYGKSPDIGDAAALTFAFPLNKADNVKKMSKAKDSNQVKWRTKRNARAFAESG